MIDLNELYEDCIKELKSIGISIENCGEIYINISKRNNKRYGCCKQEKPDYSTKFFTKRRGRRAVEYAKYKIHYIEISPWVLNLNENLIKNTIIHELIHCFPYCNNHGLEFKKYAKYINEKLGYNISRVGNKEEDLKISNIPFSKENFYKYKIECKNCGQNFYRKRLNKNFIRKYRCGKCNRKIDCI